MPYPKFLISYSVSAEIRVKAAAGLVYTSFTSQVAYAHEKRFIGKVKVGGESENRWVTNRS